MKHIFTILLLFLFGSPVFCQAQTRGDFLQKVDNGDPTFMVRVEADSPNDVYVEGDLLVATVSSSHDGYLYLFYRDANAKVTVLFPNQHERNNRIQRNIPMRVPGSINPTFQIKVGTPFGHETLKAVVSKKQLPFIDGMVEAKFNIASYASINDNEGNTIATAMARQPEADWAEHEISIRTVPSGNSSGNNDNSPPLSSGTGTVKMHLILAADVNSADSVGNVVRSDTQNVRRLIENNIVGARLNIVDLQEKLQKNRPGSLLTKNDILQEIDNLNSGKDDTIFFFYSGHGAYDAVKDQYFHLASQEHVLRSDVLDKMKSKSARLVILISDCCYNQSDLPSQTRLADAGAQTQSRGMKGRALFEILFFETKGVVDITASEKGTYGFIYPKESREENGISKGSVFTWNLRKVLNAETHASKHWNQIFELVRDETNEDYKRTFKPHIDNGQVTQKELKPHAFTLP